MACTGTGVASCMLHPLPVVVPCLCHSSSSAGRTVLGSAVTARLLHAKRSTYAVSAGMEGERAADDVDQRDMVPMDATVEEVEQAGRLGHGDVESTRVAGGGEGCAGAGGPPPAARAGVARARPDTAPPATEPNGLLVGPADSGLETHDPRRHKAGTSNTAARQGGVGLAATGTGAWRRSSGGGLCEDRPKSSAKRAAQVSPKVPEEGRVAQLDAEVSWSIPAALVPESGDSTSRMERCRGAPGVPSSSVTLSRWGFVPQVGVETLGDRGGGRVRLAAAAVVLCFRHV